MILTKKNTRCPIECVYQDSAAAQTCIDKMHGRFFAGKTVHCDWYDEISNYDVPESEEMKLARQKAWDAWLEKGEE